MDINLAINEAMQKANDGDIKSAQVILANVLRQEPRNARAWYLLSQIVGDPNREIDCLKKVLEIEPNSQQAKARLQKLQQVDVQAQPVPSVPKVQQTNSKIPPNSLAPKIQPVIAKKTSPLLIVLVSIIAGILVLTFALRIINAPDATHCVKVVQNICLVSHDALNSYLFGSITNTCNQSITSINLHGIVVNPRDVNSVFGEVTALQDTVLAPGQEAQFNLVAVNTYYDSSLACVVDAESAYFVK